MAVVQVVVATALVVWLLCQDQMAVVGMGSAWYCGGSSARADTGAVRFDATPSQSADQDGAPIIHAVRAVSASSQCRNSHHVRSKSELEEPNVRPKALVSHNYGTSVSLYSTALVLKLRVQSGKTMFHVSS